MQIATVRFAFCSLLMLVQSVAVPATASATTASAVAATATAALQDRFCYSYIFRNYTAEDANDLHIGFEDPGGSGAVSDVYLGPDNPFISVTLSSSTNPSGTAQTAIAYSNGKVSPGEAARISFCNRVSKMRSVPSWTLDGAAIQPDPHMLGIDWQWNTLKTLKVALFNDQAVTMTVTSLFMYDASVALSSEDLTPDAATGMAPVVNLSEDALVLAPNSVQTVEVTFGALGLAQNFAERANGVMTNYAVSPNHPYVLGVVSAPIDDLGDETQLILQAYSPQAVYLPLVVR